MKYLGGAWVIDHVAISTVFGGTDFYGPAMLQQLGSAFGFSQAECVPVSPVLG